jgi:uncharacterized protein (UPF0332 family)
MNEMNDFISKAEKFLETANLTLNSGDYDSCVSRCYYAMFIITEAVLLTKDLKASSHKGVISLFGEHFVKSGIFDRSFGRELNDAFDKRLIGDYGVGFNATEEDANGLLDIAINYVNTLKDYLNKWLEKEE